MVSSSPTYPLLWRNNFRVLRFLTAIFFGCIVSRNNLCSNQQFVSSKVPPSPILPLPLRTLRLDGYLTSEGLDHAAKDFGKICHHLPSAVLHPKSVADISSTVKRILEMGTTTELTVAARGHGHSLQGQSQAPRGVVIKMESLRSDMHFHTGELPYVDVSGGELWINILNEGLKHGLAPKSWTDYIHLTVGGTLSNAGISGQAFRHGPQINNVYQLEVVTGKGEVITCSEKQHDDLFYGVLGGLGQFGIITRARISLEPAPKMVKWIRVLYSDFSTFTKDQERLISTEDTFDYIEGFVLINRTGLLNKWRSYSFSPKHPIQASQFTSEGKTLFCLEVAKYFNPDETTDDTVNQQIDRLLSELGYIQSTLFLSNVSYVEFLDRVHTSELKLREKGLWEIPHPWLNLLIPRSRVHDFAAAVFGGILTDTNNGPVLIYPVNQSKWNTRTSLVTPGEDVFYQVAFLSSAVPSSKGADELEQILNRNKRILDFCKSAPLGVKQYLPHYSSQEEWRAHFGPQWDDFARRKSKYDPLAILTPGHQIFKKARAFS